MDVFNPFPAAFLDWMQSTWINSLVLDYAWTWPILEILHFLGMSLLFGPIIIMDLRLIGFERLSIPVVSVHTLVPLTLVGFLTNFVTGTMFFFGDPYRYAVNVSFQLKMVLVFLAGLNALVFWLKLTPVLERAGPNDNLPATIKIVGVSSLLMWGAVLCFGRLIPYLGTG